MDLCVYIILVEAPLQDTPLAESTKYVSGDLFAAELATNVGVWNGIKYNSGVISSPKTGHLYITGVPEVVTLAQINSVFSSRVTEDYLDQQNNIQKRIIRRSKFRLDLSLLTAEQLTELQTTKQLNITWDQARTLVSKKVVTDKFDRSTDNETAKITALDLTTA